MASFEGTVQVQLQFPPHTAEECSLWYLRGAAAQGLVDVRGAGQSRAGRQCCRLSRAQMEGKGVSTLGKGDAAACGEWVSVCLRHWTLGLYFCDRGKSRE